MRLALIFAALKFAQTLWLRRRFHRLTHGIE
jgi:hypothetical protein